MSAVAASAAPPSLVSAQSEGKGGLTASSGGSKGELHLCIKLDFPAKTQFLKCDAKSTIANLKTECGKLFQLSSAELKRHEFRTVSYGSNASQLGMSKSGDESTLSDDGVQNRALILITAPTDVKPVREFDKKKKDAEEEDEDVVSGCYPSLP